MKVRKKNVQDVMALETYTNKGVGAMNVDRIIVKDYSDMEMLSSFYIIKGNMENERN